MPFNAGGAVIEELDCSGARYLVIGMRVPRPALLLDLTRSEIDVLDAWLSGLPMRTIATQRQVAVRTVANQIASIYRKCGVGSRSELHARIQAASREGVEP